MTTTTDEKGGTGYEHVHDNGVWRITEKYTVSIEG